MLAGPDDKDIPFLYLFDGDYRLLPTSQHSRGLWGQLHEIFERIRGLSLRTRLQHLSNRDECQNHGRRLKIEPMQIPHGSLHILRRTHGKQHDDTIAERDTGS